MFHVALVSVLMICFAQATPILLGDSSTVDISSSKHKNDIQMVITASGSIGEQMVLTTQALSPEHGSHTLRLSQDKIDFIPRLNEAIIFNYEHADQYFVGLSHTLKSQTLHFLPLEITWKGNKIQMFLPAFDMKMHQIDKNSLFKCHNTLISIETDDKIQRVTMTMFTKDKKDSIWYLGPNWSHNWRHYHEKVYFGGAYRDNLTQNVRISLTNNKYCEFDLKSLTKTATHLNNKKYYTIDDILSWATPLQLKDEVKKEVNQEL